MTTDNEEPTEHEGIAPTPQEVYENLWKDRVETDGEMDREKVIVTLHEFASVLYNLTFLYNYLTEGTHSSPFTDVTKIMEFSDNFVAQTIDAEVGSVLQSLLQEVEWAENSLDPKLQFKHISDSITTLLERLNQ